jgi:hypothetical protein
VAGLAPARADPAVLLDWSRYIADVLHTLAALLRAMPSAADVLLPPVDVPSPFGRLSVLHVLGDLFEIVLCHLQALGGERPGGFCEPQSLRLSPPGGDSGEEGSASGGDPLPSPTSQDLLPAAPDPVALRCLVLDVAHELFDARFFTPLALSPTSSSAAARDPPSNGQHGQRLTPAASVALAEELLDCVLSLAARSEVPDARDAVPAEALGAGGGAPLLMLEQERGAFLRAFSERYHLLSRVSMLSAGRDGVPGGALDAARVAYVEAVLQATLGEGQADPARCDDAGAADLGAAARDLAAVRSVLDVFPALGGGFVSACLAQMGGEPGRVIDALLTDSLPPSLAKLDRGQPLRQHALQALATAPAGGPALRLSVMRPEAAAAVRELDAARLSKAAPEVSGPVGGGALASEGWPHSRQTERSLSYGLSPRAPGPTCSLNAKAGGSAASVCGAGCRRRR